MITIFTRAMTLSVALMLFASVFSCRFGSVGFLENYKRAVKSGFSRFPEAMQMESLFGEGDHFISSPGHDGIRKWNSVVFFGCRYTLTMEVHIKTDPEFSRVTEVVGSPLFILNEATQVTTSPDGSVRTQFSNDWKFGLNDWKKVFDAKGDFSVIGIKTKNDAGIQGFDAYVKGEREPRLRVRPD
jgi:hypothetical protein